MITYKVINNEVLYTTESITNVRPSDITFLKTLALNNPRKRIRLCAHMSIKDLLHEMIIVHMHETYVRPHKHAEKSESFHIIEGEIGIVVFEDDGQIKEIIRMSLSGDDVTYLRLSEDVYHCVFVISNTAVFHETTNGPFNKTKTVFAPWSPAENDYDGVICYMTYIKTLFEKLEENKK